MNTIKEPKVEVTEESVPQPVVEESKPAKAAKKIMSSLNIFSFMEKEKIIKMMPFVFFITLLALIYIANSYYAEKTIREIDSTGKEIKELRSSFISVQSELMMKSKQTEVLNAVQQIGLKQSLQPPQKIIVKADNEKTN
jgi:hypothetical protein